MNGINVDFLITKETLKSLAFDVVRFEVKLSELEAENMKLKGELVEKNATISQLNKELESVRGDNKSLSGR